MTSVVTTNVEVVSLEIPNTNVVVTDQTSILVSTDTNTAFVVQGVIDTVVVSTEEATTLLASGGQGPQGIPGSSTEHTYLVSGTILGGGRVVTADALGKAVYADSNSTYVVGITTGATVVDEVAQIQVSGMLTEPSWNWTLNLPIFATTAGMLTQTPPTSGTILVIGYPVLSNKIFIDKQPPIVLG